MQNNRLISIIDSFYIFSLRFLSIDSVSCLIDAAWWRWRRNPTIPSTWTPPIDNEWHAARFRQMDSAVSQFRWNSHQRHLPAVSWVRDERILNVALKSDSGRRNKTELHQQSTCVQRDEWGRNCNEKFQKSPPGGHHLRPRSGHSSFRRLICASGCVTDMFMNYAKKNSSQPTPSVGGSGD